MSSLVDLDILTAELLSTEVFSDTAFLTFLLPTAVETVKDASLLTILTFYRFAGHVSLCGGRTKVPSPPPPFPSSLISR